MAVLGRIDQMMAFKGVSLTIAPLGAVCAVLFTAPDSPPAKVPPLLVNTNFLFIYISHTATNNLT
uniref:Uncharacterized protein n=1 Tax=Aegilops tauschii subsp. strangulata TaxID=200361 RepID=A0A453H3F2_AEGTS